MIVIITQGGKPYAGAGMYKILQNDIPEMISLLWADTRY